MMLLVVVVVVTALLPTGFAVAPGTPGALIALFPDGSVPGEIPGKIGPEFWHRGRLPPPSSTPS